MADNSARGANGAPEQEALMTERRRPPEDKGRLRNFLGFLYNKQSGTVLGRTGMSWLEITVFYIIFYSCLIGFWAICLAVFVQTLDPKKPTWYGKGSIIGINPGMGYQPWLKDDPESTLIMFNKTDNETYGKYRDQLAAFLTRYDNTTGTRICTGDMSNQDISENMTESCRVVPDTDFPDCRPDDDYGYESGQPCVAISINRLVGWQPVGYPGKDSAPQAVKTLYDPKYIAISCEGEYYSDQENMGEVKYMPSAGLGFKFYPYQVVPNYHQPIVMAKFMSLPRGVLVEIECKAYAYNVIHDTADRQGMVHFEVLMDE